MARRLQWQRRCQREAQQRQWLAIRQQADCVRHRTSGVRIRTAAGG